jgi:hypothetical protein
MKKLIFLAISAMMLFSSCENEAYFELERPAQSPWLTIAEFDRAPIGLYYYVFNTGGYGDPFRAWMLYQNAVADDVSWINPGDSRGWFRDTQNTAKDFLDNVWKVYVPICSVNDALAFVADNNGNPWPKMSADDKTYNLNRIIGELYFIRGFCYYMLATTYCNAYVPGGANDAKHIPLLTKVATDFNDASNPNIGTDGEVWAQIQADFEKAYSLLPERYISGKMNVSYQAGRANKFAAAFMLARTHFAMGNYTKTAEYASVVIDQNGGDYDLSEDPIMAFNKSTMSRGKEVVFWDANYDLTFGKDMLLDGHYNHIRTNVVNSWSSCNMDSSTLIRLGWLSNPKTGVNLPFNAAALRDKRFSQVMIIREPLNTPQTATSPSNTLRSYVGTGVQQIYTSLFANKAGRGGATATSGIAIGAANTAKRTNTPILRLAEMYLTRSICRFKAGNMQGAADDLNVVRARAWDATVAGVAYASSPNYVTASNITEQMIGDERLIEMYCEGDRINYLRGMKAPAIGPGERKLPVVPYTDAGFVWKIPVTESDLNFNL